MKVDLLEFKLKTLYRYHASIHNHKALADYYGLHVQAIYAWMKKDEIPDQRIQPFKKVFQLDESLLCLSNPEAFKDTVKALYSAHNTAHHPSSLHHIPHLHAKNQTDTKLYSGILCVLLILIAIGLMALELSFLAMIWIFSITILILFFLAEELLTEQEKQHLTEFLRHISFKQWSIHWPLTFARVFDGVFTSQHRSLNCFVRSSIASLSVLMCCFLLLKNTYPDACFFHHNPFYAILWVIFLGMLFNVIPDYLSLLETRFILDKLAGLSSNRTGVRIVALLFADFILTSLIFIIYFSAVIAFLYLIHLKIDPEGSVMAFIVDVAAKIGIGNSKVGQDLDLVSTLYHIFLDAFSVSGLAGELSIFLYSTYLTSIWLYLFLLGSGLIGVLVRFQGLFSFKPQYIKFDERPLLAIALVVIIPGWLICLIGYFTFSLFTQTQTNTMTEPKKPETPILLSTHRPNMIAITGGHSGDKNSPTRNLVETDTFKISQTPITVGQFRHFVIATGYQVQALNANAEPGCQVAGISGHLPSLEHNWQNPGFTQQADHPVVCISWFDAKAYANWLSELTGEQFDLPTEAQWQYAARGNLNTRYFWGDEYLPNHAHCIGCDSPFDDNGTAPVASFAANGFGLYDMAGNVWQWVYGQPYDDKPGVLSTAPPDEIIASDQQVVRGGSWFNNQSNMNVFYRGVYVKHQGYNNCGFRVVSQ